MTRDRAHDVGKERTSGRDERLDRLLESEVIDAGVAPTAVVGWGLHGSHGWDFRVGAAGAEVDAIYDLASLTKPMTAIVAMRRAVPLGATVGELLPELRGTPASGASLENLLTHRAALPSWGALYRDDSWTREEGAIVSRPMVAAEPADLASMLFRAASRVEPRASGRDADELYSDIGYVLAGAMIARALGRDLASEWEATCGATSSARYRERDSTFDRRVVPTEIVDWRGGVVKGVVHDENAYALEQAGGDPGHAGAFGTVDEVARLAMAFVDALEGRDDSLLSRDRAERMIATRGGGSHRIGWDTVTPGASSSGSRFGPRSLGHLGFTGTSVWADPDAGVVAVLLTNRVHPTRDNDRIRAARPKIHDALWNL